MNDTSEREIRKEIFQDTMHRCETEPRLKEAIEASLENQFVVHNGPMPKDGNETHRYNKKADIIVTGNRSYEAARAYSTAGKRTCVLNFANAFQPGGGVKNGSSAQEECLCRCSTLYPCISHNSVLPYYHGVHRWLQKNGAFSNKGSDDCIYTPGVIVLKSDVSEPELLPEEEWYEVDVITCAAPDLRKSFINPKNFGSGKVSEEELQRIHEKRARRIFEIARRQQDEVLILGAFGCGVFANQPEIVACAYKEILKEYAYDFDTVEFAIGSTEGRNYKAFKNIIEPV